MKPAAFALEIICLLIGLFAMVGRHVDFATYFSVMAMYFHMRSKE